MATAHNTYLSKVFHLVQSLNWPVLDLVLHDVQQRGQAVSHEHLVGAEPQREGSLLGTEGRACGGPIASAVRE
eukprot:1140641-Pelagomonas_calceolata.AAC.1